MKLIHLLLKKSWFIVILASLTGLLSGASSTGLIALINLKLKGTEFPTPTLAWSFAGLCGLLLSTSAISQVLIARLSLRVVFNLQIFLTRSILACPLRHLEEIGSHRLLAALTDDVTAISNASSSISTLCVNVALSAACMIYLSWLSVPLFLLLLGLLLFGSVIYLRIVKRARQAYQIARDVRDKLFQHFQTTTEGNKELKLHRLRRHAFLAEDLQFSATHFRDLWQDGITFFAVASSWGLVLFFMVIGLLLFCLPQIVPVSVSVLSSYSLTIIFMISPLRGILSTFSPLSRANIALEKIESLGLSLAAQIPEQELGTPLNLKSEWTTLELVNLTHTYYSEREESHFTLGPINLTFQAGELVYIVGGNGSGKSTLVKLITGLYLPETGVIQIGGHPITDTNREWYRQQFSVVFSDFYLFDRLLGLEPSKLDSQIQEYLVKLQLDHKVQVKEGKLSTTALSQGQRKRLALLTAYLENRPIYVFDEWASDQDPLFKDIFYTQLLLELKNRGKTVLVVSHDDRYYKIADRLIKLDYGKVVYN